MTASMYGDPITSPTMMMSDFPSGDQATSGAPRYGTEASDMDVG